MKTDPILLMIVACALCFGVFAIQYGCGQWLRALLRSYRSKERVFTNRPGRGLSVLPSTIRTAVPKTPIASQEDIDAIVARMAAPQPNEPAGELEEESIANWHRLSVFNRRRCVSHLRSVIGRAEDGASLISKWREQKANGLRIGCHEFGFHFGTGMWVRNVLREVVKDNQLPPVRYEGGGQYQNWDDFYYGAINELAGTN